MPRRRDPRPQDGAQVRAAVEQRDRAPHALVEVLRTLEAGEQGLGQPSLDVIAEAMRLPESYMGRVVFRDDRWRAMDGGQQFVIHRLSSVV